MNVELSNTISAEAILKSKYGRSIADTNVAITTENVEEFLPANKTIVTSTRIFQDLGFEVFVSDVTLSLTGNPSLFEKIFRVKLTITKDERTNSVIVCPDGELVIPGELKDFVEKIFFPEPPELFV